MNYKPTSKLSSHLLLSIALVALPLLLFGCSSGNDGAPGTSSGTLTGSVIDTFNNKVANVTVTPSPAVDSLPGGRVTTAADGTYSMTIAHRQLYADLCQYRLCHPDAVGIRRGHPDQAKRHDHAGTEGGGGRDRDRAVHLPRRGFRHPDGDPGPVGSRTCRETGYLRVEGPASAMCSERAPV